MSLRTRLVLSAALAVAVAVTGAAFFVYARTRGELHREVDTTLRQRAGWRAFPSDFAPNEATAGTDLAAPRDD